MTNEELIDRITLVNEIVDTFLDELHGKPVAVYRLICIASNRVQEARELITTMRAIDE